MSRFTIDTLKASENASFLAKWRVCLKDCAEMLEALTEEPADAGTAQIQEALRMLSGRIKSGAEKGKRLQDALEKAAAYYALTENRLTEPSPSQENPAYNGRGSYGGSQVTPLAAFRGKREGVYEELCRIVRSYYPSYSDSQVEGLMERLELEGCGYVALANTLFGRFAGRESQFRNIFGFSMYNRYGELNYDLLVTDVYCAGDDPGKTGMTREEREKVWERYLGERGIPVDVRTVEVTRENFEELSWQGEIIVGISPCILFDKEGRRVTDESGGHAVTVTGITEDGMLRVSSWGMEYYVRPEDPVYERIQFQQVCYE